MSCCDNGFDLLHSFISPITGRVLCDFNYVLVGNKQGIAIPSPILIDVRLDLIALRKRYNSLVKGDIVIGQRNNELPNAQVLYELDNGYLYTTDGILSTNTLIPIGALPNLPYQNIWIGDITNRPVPRQRVGLENLPSFRSINPLSNFGLYGLYTGQFIGITSPLDIGQPTITQRIDMSNMPTLSRGKMWIGKINYLPPYITIDSIFPYVHVVGSLNWNAPSILPKGPGPWDAVPTEIGLNPGELFIGDVNNPGEITTTSVLLPTNLPNLRYNYIWRGNVNNRPVEVNDLTILEGSFDTLKTRVDHIEFVSLPLIDAELLLHTGELAAHSLAIGVLEFTVNTVLVPAVAVLTTAVTVAIPAALAGISSRVTNLENRTLDQIPVAVNAVDLNNQRIGNLADPIFPLNAVNLQTLNAAISGFTVSVVGTANQITANTVAGVVTLSLPASVIITTSLNVGNLRLNGNTFSSTDTNGDIIISPDGIGNIDVDIHRITNLVDPLNPLDAVNLQYLDAAIAASTVGSVVGTANEITANTVAGVVTLSLPADVIIATSLNVSTMELFNNTLFTTNTNADLLLSPNGTGNVDVTNSRIINLSDPINPLDAVNLQYMDTAIAASTVASVLGTANQITANTVAGVVTLSLPNDVIITTSLNVDTMELLNNTLYTTNINSDLTLSPNGTGRVNVDNSRIMNLADPINSLDAVNLQYLTTTLANDTIQSVVGTANQITASTVLRVVTLSLPSAVTITTSLAAGNLKLLANTLSSTNTNGNIVLDPNGTGNIDVNNHRILNLSDPIGVLDAVNYQSMTALTDRTLDLLPLAAANVNINNHRLTNVSDPVGVLDAVNLQYLTATIAASSIASVTGTANQITASTVSGAVTLSLPSSVIITTAVTAGNLELTGNTLQSNNANGAINVVPNGSGNILLTPGTGFVGIGGTPSFILDVFGTTRVSRLLGRTAFGSTAIGTNTIVGTGNSFTVVGSESAGIFTLNTGTGITVTGVIITFTFATSMPNSNYAVSLTPTSATAAGVVGMYIIVSSLNAFSIRCTTLLTASTTYQWRFTVIGNLP